MLWKRSCVEFSKNFATWSFWKVIFNFPITYVSPCVIVSLWTYLCVVLKTELIKDNLNKKIWRYFTKYHLPHLLYSTMRSFQILPIFRIFLIVRHLWYAFLLRWIISSVSSGKYTNISLSWCISCRWLLYVACAH